MSEQKKRGPKPKTEITMPQRRALLEIEAYIRRHGFSPTIKELAEELELSTSSVQQLLDHLERKGYVRRTPNSPRGLAVIRRTYDNPARLTPIPLIGMVAAGSPVVAEENIVGQVLVNEEYPDAARCFALKVQGASMQGAAIADGDVVIVRRQPLAESGDIVVALVDGEATVKRLFLRDAVIELQPDNPLKSYRPIPIGPETDLRIIGKVVAVRGAV